MTQKRRQQAERNAPSQARAFTVIELLVVVAIIALMAAVLLPSLTGARQSAKTAVCSSNIRQLVIANHGYAAENRDYFVPAAPDEPDGFGGRRRWHGMRKSAGVSSNPDENLFDPRFSPLARYIEGAPTLPASLIDSIAPQPDRARLKECPAYQLDRDFSRAASANAFEAGAGGYGYNNTYVGGRYDLYGGGWKATLLGAQTAEVRRPTVTLMFTDTAFVQRDPAARNYAVIEQSFCYPPFFFESPGVLGPFMAAPSIHFRHNQQALCGWTDGHTDRQRMIFSGPAAAFGIPEGVNRSLKLGWPGPRTNDWFDLK